MSKPQLRGFSPQWKRFKKPTKKSRMQPKPDPQWLTEMLDFRKDRDEKEGQRVDETIAGIGFLNKRTEAEMGPPPAHFRTGWVPYGEPLPTADIASLKNVPPIRTWAPGSTRPPREGPPPKSAFQKIFGVWDEEGNMLEQPEPLPDWREGIDFGEGSNLTLKHTLNKREDNPALASPDDDADENEEEAPKPRTFFGKGAHPEDQRRWLAGEPPRSAEEKAADDAREAEAKAEAESEKTEDEAQTPDSEKAVAAAQGTEAVEFRSISSTSYARHVSQSTTILAGVAAVGFVLPLTIAVLALGSSHKGSGNAKKNRKSSRDNCKEVDMSAAQAV